jgi:ferredoxin-type protein NapF
MFGRSADGTLPVRPPWSREASVVAQCTGCGDCAAACPEEIIRLDDRSRPVVAFAHGECTFCGACAEACAVPVFTAREARAFAHRVRIEAGCLAVRDVVCQACGDACPEAAIRFRARLGGPPRPEVLGDRCTGCGACVGICPVDAVAVVPAGRRAAADA